MSFGAKPLPFSFLFVYYFYFFREGFLVVNLCIKFSDTITCAGNQKTLLRTLGFKGCCGKLMWEYENEVLGVLEV